METVAYLAVIGDTRQNTLLEDHNIALVQTEVVVLLKELLKVCSIRDSNTCRNRFVDLLNIGRRGSRWKRWHLPCSKIITLLLSRPK
jgi:hypothetical protein